MQSRYFLSKKRFAISIILINKLRRTITKYSIIKKHLTWFQSQVTYIKKIGFWDKQMIFEIVLIVMNYFIKSKLIYFSPFGCQDNLSEFKMYHLSAVTDYECRSSNFERQQTATHRGLYPHKNNTRNALCIFNCIQRALSNCLTQKIRRSIFFTTLYRPKDKLRTTLVQISKFVLCKVHF